MRYSKALHGKIASLCVISIAVFAVFFLVAMILYPGGTAGDRSRQGYSFTRNFFSDTGRTRSYSGSSNLPSMVFFALALIVANLGLLLFHGANLRLYRHAFKPWNWIAGLCGMASALAAMLIPFFPDDLLPLPHLVATLSFSNLLLLSLLGYAFIALRDREMNRIHAWIILGYVAYLFLYMPLVMLDLGLDASALEVLQATGQKIAIIAGFSCLCALAFGIRGKLKR